MKSGTLGWSQWGNKEWEVREMYILVILSYAMPMMRPNSTLAEIVSLGFKW